MTDVPEQLIHMGYKKYGIMKSYSLVAFMQ